MHTAASATAEQAVERAVTRGGRNCRAREHPPRVADRALRLLRHRDEPRIPGEQLVAAGARDGDSHVLARGHRHEVAVHAIDGRLIERGGNRDNAVANIIATDD